MFSHAGNKENAARQVCWFFSPAKPRFVTHRILWRGRNTVRDVDTEW